MLTSRFHITTIIVAVLATAALMLAASPARAQCEFEWKPGVGLAAGTANRVGVLTVYNGNLIAGGDFTEAGGVLVNHIAQWDGNSWSALGSGMNAPASGHLTVYNGNLIAAGSFTTAGGVQANHIAQWDGETETWSALGSGMNDIVMGLAVYDGKLIAAGRFTTAGGVGANRIAQWDGSSWSALGTGMTGGDNIKVGALAVYNGKLIAAGYFTHAGGVAANCIAQWDGSSWSPLGGDELEIWDIFGLMSLTVYNDKLILGGSFRPYVGDRWECVAQWDGNSWSSLGSGLENGKAFDVTVYNGNLIATGWGVLAGGQTYTNYIAQWDGASWSALGGALNERAGALTIYEDHLIVGGWFTTVGGIASPYWARWGFADNHFPTANAGDDKAIHAGRWVVLDGSESWDDNTAYEDLLYAWTLTVTPEGSTATLLGPDTANPSLRTDLPGTYEVSLVVTDECEASSEPDTVTISASPPPPGAECEFEWKPGVGLAVETANRVVGLTVYNGNLIVGGDFTEAGGVLVNHIAQWDGSSWSALGSGMGGPTVANLAIYDGNLIACGSFTTAGGIQVNHIARWDGNSWSALGSGMNHTVLAVAVYDGDLIAGGYFTTAGGESANLIARWDEATSSWSELGGGMTGEEFGANANVANLAVYNGELIAGGRFTAAGGESANLIARWDEETSSWSELGGGLVNVDWGVMSLAVYDGKLIAGGGFTLPGGGPNECIAQWDGSSWSSLGGGLSSKVWGMTEYNGNLIATGWGVLAGGARYTNYLAQWDGTSWSALGGAMNERARRLTVYEGHIVVGGWFTTVDDGNTSPYWARWGSDNLPPTAVAGADQTIHAGQIVFLDGGESYDDNTPSQDLGYAWTLTQKPVESATELTDPNTATPSFTADLPGTYEVSLLVTDECAASSEPDTVTISSENLAPTADAGPDRGAYPDDVVELDGTGSSDPEDDPLTYTWEIMAAPDGSIAALDDVHSDRATLIPDLLGQYTVQLVVDDGFEASAPDEVVISVVTPEEFAEITTMEGLNLVVELPPESVTTAGNQTALGNFHTQAIAALQSGDTAKAIDKLNKAISRTDGCVLRGEPDGSGKGRDWITDCAAQEEVYWRLMDALDAISSP
jgi:hypothetical protein